MNPPQGVTHGTQLIFRTKYHQTINFWEKYHQTQLLFLGKYPTRLNYILAFGRTSQSVSLLIGTAQSHLINTHRFWSQSLYQDSIQQGSKSSEHTSLQPEVADTTTKITGTSQLWRYSPSLLHLHRSSERSTTWNMHAHAHVCACSVHREVDCIRHVYLESSRLTTWYYLEHNLAQFDVEIVLLKPS